MATITSAVGPANMSPDSSASAKKSGGCGCGCGGHGEGECHCHCPPSEFTRLRYAYGLRLGVVELTDEQSYFVGKHRFHNVRCHGAGVLCGLQALPFVFPQGSGNSTNVIRVSKGAAIDSCGREIIVPCDQCIDVGAWFAKNQSEITLQPSQTQLLLHVAVRYRECPSDPAVVPPDPCGCDSGGCAFTRVHESFELRLLATPPKCAANTFPPADQLLAALSTPNGLAQLLASSQCPQGACEDWVCLADLTASLAYNPNAAVSAISTPNNGIAGRTSLLSTSALQGLVLEMIAQSGQEVGVGPAITGFSFAGADKQSGTIAINLDLIDDTPPPPGQPTPLVQNTLTGNIQLIPFSNNGWGAAITPGPLDLSGVTTIKAPFANLGAGTYQLVVTSPATAPIVDSKLRPLRPVRYSANLTLALNSSNVLIQQ